MVKNRAKKAKMIGKIILPLGDIVKHTAPISPRKDFSPLRLQVDNMSKRARMVYLFRTGTQDEELVVRKLHHPDMHYGVLCSMLERVQLKVVKTYLRLIKGPAEQYAAPIVIEELGKDPLHIAFDKIPRYADGSIQTTDTPYRIGPNRRVCIRVNAQSSVELSFFIASGLVPQLSTKWEEAEAEQE